MKKNSLIALAFCISTSGTAIAADQWLKFSSIQWDKEPEVLTHRGLTFGVAFDQQIVPCSDEMLKQSALEKPCINDKKAIFGAGDLSGLGAIETWGGKAMFRTKLPLDLGISTSTKQVTRISTIFTGDSYDGLLKGLSAKYGTPSYTLPDGGVIDTVDQPPKIGLNGEWGIVIDPDSNFFSGKTTRGTVWAGKRHAIVLERHYEGGASKRFYSAVTPETRLVILLLQTQQEIDADVEARKVASKNSLEAFQEKINQKTKKAQSAL